MRSPRHREFNLLKVAQLVGKLILTLILTLVTNWVESHSCGMSLGPLTIVIRPQIIAMKKMIILV